MHSLTLKNFFLIKCLLSYLGILLFILVFLDINFFKLFPIYLLKDFIILFTLIIFTFIGAIHWNTYKNLYNIFYSFIPSLLSTCLIFLYLFNYDRSLILALIFICLLMQLAGDFFLYRSKDFKDFFYKVRLPITIILLINISYIILV